MSDTKKCKKCGCFFEEEKFLKYKFCFDCRQEYGDNAHCDNRAFQQGSETRGRKMQYFFGVLLHDAPDRPSWWAHEKEEPSSPLPKVYIRDKKTGKRKRVKYDEVQWHGRYD